MLRIGSDIGENQHIVCPVCNDDYVHHESRSAVIDGDDSYKASPHAKGDVIAIPMYCENGGHQFSVLFGFHKGYTYTWCVVTGNDPDYWTKITGA